MSTDTEHRRDIEENRKLRTAFMRWLYTTTGGSQDELTYPANFYGSEQMDEASAEKLRRAIQYLEGEYLLRAHWTMGGLPSVQITHPGITEMEQALGEPDRPTQHFAPISVVNVLGSMINSQVLQGSPGAHQHATNGVNELADAQSFLSAARVALDAPEFDSAFRAKVEDDLDLIESELTSETPNWKLTRALGRSAKGLIEAGLGGVLTQMLLSGSWPSIS